MHTTWKLDNIEACPEKKVGNMITCHWSTTVVTFRSHYEKDRKLLMSMTSGFLDVSMTPKINCFHFWRHQDASTNPRNTLSNVKNNMFGNLNISGIQHVEMFGKDGHRTIRKVHLIFLKILNMGSISSRKMKWNVGNMGWISSKHITWIVWIFETLKPRDQETSKPSNQETSKLINQETKKLVHIQLREYPYAISHDNLLLHWFQRIRTYILIDFLSTDCWCSFPKPRGTLIDVHGLLT